MARREYQSGQPTTLLNPLGIGGNTFTISLSDPTLLSGWPDGAEGYNFWVTVDAGKPQEERILCASRSGSVVTVSASGRGADGTTESNHAAGAEVWPSWSATDADEANAHIHSPSGPHSYTASIAEINILDGATLTTTELNYVDGVTSSIQTQLDAKTTALTAHEADTTAIHGIADTSKLATIASSSVGRKLSVQAAAPTSPAIGDIWFQVTGL
jgi:hypothetical protein